MGASRVAVAQGPLVAVNRALHPGEPDGGDRTGLWVRWAVLAVNRAIQPDKPSGGQCVGWPRGGRC